VRRVDVESAEQMYAAVQRELAGDRCSLSAPLRWPTTARSKCASAEDQEEQRDPGARDHAHHRHPRAGQASAQRPFMVGFAAETDAVEHYARAKLLARTWT
jgi:phosphopantothenoylcysteine decarboxylase/phosphopantothenate--cysteine ligase